MLKGFRLAVGLTQKDLDEGDFTVHFRTIQEIENGRTNANVNTLFRISKRLKVKPKDLFDI
ncbi:helix-turn-helix transcriptional regulator [Leptospira licerasiae]|uniref:helix-turn-helix domain-containing protein n=1 Tax=Leptospira licerasiae TaxID=447106 RepID=UPI00301648A0